MADESFPTLVPPVPPGTSFLRIDQGVDYDAASPPVSIGAGTVVRISPPGSFAGGTGQAVYIQLATPVTINGHTYNQVYYAERTPLVSVGEHVGPGSPVMAAGSNEIGFARNGQPAAPLVGGLGSGTQATTEGRDFDALVRVLWGQPTLPPPAPQPGQGPPIPPATGAFTEPTQAHVAFKRLQLAIMRDLPRDLNSAASTVHAARRHLTRRK